MGQMRFVVSPPGRITNEAVQQAYLSGIDRISWQVQSVMERGDLVLRRAVSESANLHIPWQVEGRGWLTLSSGSLCEQYGPYQLPLELARGTIGQLRDQLAEWQTIGLIVPKKITEKVSEAVRYFGRAAVGQEDRHHAFVLQEVEAVEQERKVRCGLGG